MRNSDPDAAVYWLARMLEGGEDPLYVARRVTPESHQGRRLQRKVDAFFGGKNVIVGEMD